jgi:hypothetical protein
VIKQLPDQAERVHLIVLRARRKGQQLPPEVRNPCRVRWQIKPYHRHAAAD